MSEHRDWPGAAVQDWIKMQHYNAIASKDLQRVTDETQNTPATGPRNRRVSFDGEQVFEVNPKNPCGSFDEALDKDDEATLCWGAQREVVLIWQASPLKNIHMYHHGCRR